MKDICKFGADGEVRTHTTLRSLEPKSNLEHPRGDEGLENQRINSDVLPPLNPTSRSTGHSTGTTPAPVDLSRDAADFADWMQALFTTGYGCEWGSAAFLASMVLGRSVEMASISYTPTPVPPRSNWAAYLRFSDANYCGGYGHSILKWSAYHFLVSLGSPAPKYEADWCHGRADVACEHLRIAVECGSTDPLKILTCLSNPESREIWLFPFGDERASHNTAYRFRRGPAYDPATMNYAKWATIRAAAERSPEVTE